MNQTFVNLRFEQIEIRFNEIEILLNLASAHQYEIDIYQALCRSAQVLLVSHFEGLYRGICRDVLDDINLNTKFHQVKKCIFYTHCDFFIRTNELPEVANKIREKLYEAFKEYPSRLKFEPFIFIDNRNPTPDNMQLILKRFGVKNFFWSIDSSDLDLVFKDQKFEIQKLRNRLYTYTKAATNIYPYTVDKSFYHPIKKDICTKNKTLWEDFINNFLKERHSIVHGHILDNPNNHDSLFLAKVKLEILLYTFIINICSAANPLFLLPLSNS